MQQWNATLSRSALAVKRSGLRSCHLTCLLMHSVLQHWFESFFASLASAFNNSRSMYCHKVQLWEDFADLHYKRFQGVGEVEILEKSLEDCVASCFFLNVRLWPWHPETFFPRRFHHAPGEGLKSSFVEFIDQRRCWMNIVFLAGKLQTSSSVHSDGLGLRQSA